MLNQNTDSHVFSWVMNADTDQVQQIHLALILRLSGKVGELDCRISVLEKETQEIKLRIDKLETTSSLNEAQLQECQDSVSLLETNFGHQVCRNEDLQNLVDFYYPPD
ncbi:hypothetical protein [Cylindrospermum sp. FACHB-282]|uniref:hypothetical protein n=1 Tax=Cylindrospermum sp. FACHB-282 TaxID=2692794 RepID=UPI0016834169|nr:hypothetical protein [Cylindrospermum sp. FACHB-282]MBD2384624.1 hypothetical protein [Cylindrospermum sp. FACHB-282]